MINTSTNSDPLLYLFYLNNTPKSAVHRSLNLLCFRDVAHYANKNDFRLHCLLEIIPCLRQIFILALDHLTHSKQSPNIKHVLIHLIVIKSLLKHVCVSYFCIICNYFISFIATSHRHQFTKREICGNTLRLSSAVCVVYGS